MTAPIYPHLAMGDEKKVKRIHKIFCEINDLLDSKKGDECVSALCMALASCVISCVEGKLISLNTIEFSSIISELINDYIKMFKKRNEPANDKLHE